MNAQSEASVPYRLPNDRSLLGGDFYNQYLVSDRAANRLQWVVTRGGKGTVGDH